VISFTQRQLDQIAQEAERAYPAECCGMLVGKDAPDSGLLVTRIVASPNIFADGANDRFQVDPQIQIDLFRELRDTDQRIIGHYHSHPDHPAEPSETDLEKAWEPELVWVIIAVEDGTSGEIKSYRIDPATGQFGELQITMREGSP